jgi:hypothetical protein
MILTSPPIVPCHDPLVDAIASTSCARRSLLARGAAFFVVVSIATILSSCFA